MYYMIGLPARRMPRCRASSTGACAPARSGGTRSAARFSVHVSVSNFVPKPHTPFQWEGMSSREQLAAKQAYMRRATPTRQIRLSLHDLRTSMLEGALSRGDERIAEVIERAWRAGARFDAWTEMFQEQAWHDAFHALGTTMDEEATRELGAWDELPWGNVQSGVTTEFLLDEWEQSRAETGHRRLPLGRLQRLWRLLRARAQPARALSRLSRWSGTACTVQGKSFYRFAPGQRP